MHSHQIKWMLSAAVCGIVLLETAASAETITDHFNDYGTVSDANSDTTLMGRQSLTPSENAGWAGPWTFETGPDYFSGERLTYTAPGYNNGPNQGDANDGTAGAGTNSAGGLQGNAGSVAQRFFATPLTGTIWVSALSRYSSTSGETLLWLERQEDNDYVAIRGSANGQEARLRYNGGADIAAGTGTFAFDTTRLFLVKIQMNVDGSNDSVDFYVNPDLSGGEAGLGAPLLSGSGGDAFGVALDGISVSFTDFGSRFDALRVSNDANAFEQVTLIPEPASFGLLGLGGLLALRRRR